MYKVHAYIYVHNVEKENISLVSLPIYLIYLFLDNSIDPISISLSGCPVFSLPFPPIFRYRLDRLVHRTSSHLKLYVRQIRRYG